MVKTIEVYVCPTEGCGDYYGTAGMPDLHTRFTGPKSEDQPVLEITSGSPYRHTRAECPSCRARGRRVERVRMRVAVDMGEAVTVETPALPSGGRYADDVVSLHRNGL